MDESDVLEIIKQARQEKWATLDLAQRQLRGIPPEIGQLTSLKTLILGSNYLTSVPSELGQLVNLQKLHIGDNRLTSVPATPRTTPAEYRTRQTCRTDHPSVASL